MSFTNFFFQAEDGIRDDLVTGVQTCALPIFPRIIGKEGRARRNIEELTGTLISVSGHTISIIGTFQSVSMAKDALEKLIEGRQHGTVYKILKKRRKKVKKEKALGLWEGSEPAKKKP